MKLERRLPMAGVESVPLLWLLIADFIALLVALAAILGWLACLGTRDISMRWEAKGLRRPDLRRTYQISLPAAW